MGWENESMISVHPNGFLQFELPEPFDNQRIHIFDRSVRRQSVNTAIHDHRFGFQSTVLHGKIVNTRIHVEDSPSGKYRIYSVVPMKNKETKLVPTIRRVNITHTWTETIKAGQEYWMQPGAFHMTKNLGLTVTLMKKTFKALKNRARVLVPVGQRPDNKFRRVY